MANALILGVVTCAAYYDARWRRVPNWLVAAFAVGALAWHAASGGLTGLGASAAGLAIALVVLFPLFFLRGLGAGDVKFFAALGAAVGYRLVPALLVLTVLIAAAMALVLVLARGLLGKTLRNLARWVRARLAGGSAAAGLPTIDSADAVLVPFTAATAVATWLVLLVPGR